MMKTSQLSAGDLLSTHKGDRFQLAPPRLTGCSRCQRRLEPENHISYLIQAKETLLLKSGEDQTEPEVAL